MAARLIAPDHRVSFAAASGSGERSLYWVLERALSNGWSSPSAWSSWAEGANGPLLDREAREGLPAVRELDAWLDRSIGQLEQASRSVSDNPRPVQAWIEAALTVESVVASGGLAASRSRARVWAMARLRWEGPAGERESNHGVAARRLGDLPAEGWLSTVPPTATDSGARGDLGDATFPLVFWPEPAAVLVLALVRSLHGPAGTPGFAVGPAWRVVDDPSDPAAVVGGQFDDAGFPTQRTVLADGRQGIKLLGGKGFLRRPSFRDPPVPLPTHLRIVEEGEGTLPDTGLLVTTLRLHPMEHGRWSLDMDGLLLRQGHPYRLVTGVLLRVRPEELVRRCVATVGPARRTYRGVVTPSLVFD